MDIVEQKKAAEQFVNDWTGRGDEKQDTQNYWNQLLRTVYGVSVPEQYIAYEKPVANSSLADLYDPLTMPPELQKAHQNNDRAVMEAYGFDIKNTSESDCVAELMKMYQELTE